MLRPANDLASRGMERLIEGETWTCVVVGKPATGGSKTMVWKDGKPMVKGGRPVMRPASKFTKPWMEMVGAVVEADWGGHEALDGPLLAEVVFYFAPPGKASEEDWPSKTGGDLDKLLRATLDPLQGIVFTNDRRIVRVVAERRFGTPERAEITIERLPTRRVENDLQAALPV